MQDAFYDEYFQIEDNHWWFRGRRAVLGALLSPRLKPPVRTLDIGSAGGAISEMLLGFGPVTACDIDVRCATSVARRPGMSFVYGRAEALPFEPGSFDLVTVFDVLEHLDDDVLALREMARVLRPGGGVAIAVPAYQWMWGRQDEISNHRRRYTKRLLKRRLEQAGLRVQRMTAFNTFLFPPAAIIRVARRLARRADSPRETVSDFSMTRPGRLNELLARVFSSERVLLRHVDLPFGVSIFAFATVPQAA
jgi:SAM-dependent methyltransferase